MITKQDIEQWVDLEYESHPNTGSAGVSIEKEFVANMIEQCFNDLQGSHQKPVINIINECNDAYHSWISIADRLPKEWDSLGGTEFSKTVLVTDGVNISTDSVIYPHGVYGADTAPRFGSYGDIEPKDITHWQPLPEPPK